MVIPLCPNEGRRWVLSHQVRRNGREAELKYLMMRVDINNMTRAHYRVSVEREVRYNPDAPGGDQWY